ncbi:cephalosporin deacetylase [Boudabousia liubingyangii]|uniref:acetylxylan esterase n=1 Tax=Boudabousia liubingyangii TaxID=1921764 RepID=UPI00093D3C8F|nr:acetylxylan esterase [Boudabousia liubingyangii]OKL48384.1 cephalosporin deacetylase [Boudabousia liubingyangii]
MSFTDLSLEDLKTYRPKVQQPEDFRDFWEATIAESRAASPALLSVTEVETCYPHLDFYDLRFAGFAGDEVCAWLAGPSGFLTGPPQPTIIQYQGYGGGRGRPGEYLHWPTCGFIHLIMDTRGQGGDYRTGDTPDPHPSSAHASGQLTNGLESRETYYYRRLITDAVRVIDAALELDCVDPGRLFTTGASQGGGLSLIAGTLHPQVQAITADVAFLGDYLRAITVADVNPYRELRRYLAIYPEHQAEIERTLSYFDLVNFARMGQKPALWSVALMDSCVPPSSTYGAFNEYAGEKEMVVYPYNDHEGGGHLQRLRQVEWLAQFLG